ncbi:hypothetical protein P7C71_g414, partial [Lecanoromycetidae sp. Uapishka_2]
MAFNFNWSPLTADASFYTRAQELLTTALNKSPKPPIIVDDILVNELNLGSVPPDLEILEIGDLAEDRFRGIFKMCYTGLTLVFRNDPLESLKVSSTFDAIPFVRDYLQKEIEGQLRALLMDEVPVIIHRLSQRLWVPEYREKEDRELARERRDSNGEEKPVDPLASPPQDPVDISGHRLDPSQIAALTLDSGSEMHALFSQKNLLRLGALTDSHRTLSLFTPGIRDVVFRAWAGPTERGEMQKSSGKATPITPSIARSHSWTGNTSTTYVFSEANNPAQNPSRPTLSSFGSAASGLGLGGSKKSHGGRRRKHRVVNLRNKAFEGDDLESVSGESTTASGSGTMSSAPSEYGAPPQPAGREELITPPRTPEKPAKEPGDGTPMRLRNLTPRPPQWDESIDNTPRASMYETFDKPAVAEVQPRKRPTLRSSQSLQSGHFAKEKGNKSLEPSSSPALLRQLSPSPFVETSSSGILEGSWMAKMAGEIARKVQDQKAANSGFWDQNSERDEAPPPAYGA